MAIPVPISAPTLTAEELLHRIRLKGGRVYRMRQAPAVFVLTTDEKLAGWLLDKGARPGGGGEQGYMRARGGSREWDLWITKVDVEGSLWEACA